MKTEPTKNTCQTCEYFIQHYIYQSGKYIAINAGHCIRTNRIRRRLPRELACANWEQQSETYRQENIQREEPLLLVRIVAGGEELLGKIENGRPQASV